MYNLSAKVQLPIIIQIKTWKYWLYKLIFPLIPLGQNWIYLTQGCLHISYSFSGGFFFSKINMCCYISLWSHSTAENRDLNKLKPTIPDDVSILNPPFLPMVFLKQNRLKKRHIFENFSLSTIETLFNCSF